MPPPPMLMPLAQSLQLPCPDVFNLFYCRNGGQCYGRYVEMATRAEDAKRFFPGLYNQGSRYGNGNPMFDESTTLKFIPFCKCSFNFHGTRCEKTFNSDDYGFLSDMETPEIALIVVLVITVLVLLALGGIYLYTRKK
ncbi:hypothetical protein M3Y97_00618700 [Aphelenchoides bicaudatus]|nr:hypothetical protein M3Y97_00618700 [Aphelenchoides bicaudatus]